MKSEFIDDSKTEESSKSYSENGRGAISSRITKKPEEEEEEIEFVFIQENPMQRILDKDRPRGSFLGIFPMRTGYDKIWYGTGIAYFSGNYLELFLINYISFSLLGLAYGGIYGTYRGLVTAPNALFKVRMNSIINQTTRYGPWAANSLGVLALSWAIVDK